MRARNGFLRSISVMYFEDIREVVEARHPLRTIFIICFFFVELCMIYSAAEMRHATWTAQKCSLLGLQVTLAVLMMVPFHGYARSEMPPRR